METTTELNIDEVRTYIHDFARDHGVSFTEKGECGFGRACSGLTVGNNYVDHNPCALPDYMPIKELQDDRFYAPEGVEAYHKHECFAVLHVGDSDDSVYKDAIIGLYKWIQHILGQGEIELVKFDATGGSRVDPIQLMMMGGTEGSAFKFKEPRPDKS